MPYMYEVSWRTGDSDVFTLIELETLLAERGLEWDGSLIKARGWDIVGRVTRHDPS